MSANGYAHLDDLLVRIHRAKQRPAWRRRLLLGVDGVLSLSTLRVLRAVEQLQEIDESASVGDVAEYLAVERSTASRTVSGVAAAGLLNKSLAADDQRRCVLTLTDDGRRALASVTARRAQMVAETVVDWDDGAVAALVDLLARLAADFECAVDE